MKAEKARLDPQGICQPRTELVAHVIPRPGKLLVYYSDIISYELRDVPFVSLYTQC